MLELELSSVSDSGIRRTIADSRHSPCNQFGSQEPGTDDDVASFCTLNHGVTFPLMKKSDVNGDGTNEVFNFLKKQKPGLLGTTSIKWNFTSV